MRNILLLTILILFIEVFKVSAQVSEAASTDTVEKRKTSLTLAAIYSNDVNYYGQTSSDPLPYVLGNATLEFPVKIWLSAQTYKLLNYNEGISGVSLTAGYDFDLSKNLSGTVSYSRSFYPESSQLLQSVNNDMVSAGLTYDWQWLTTGLNVDYAAGEEDVLYTTFNLAKYIDLGISFSSKDYLSLNPSIDIIGGTQRFTDTVTTANEPDNNNDNPLGGLLGNNGNGKGPGKVRDIIKGKNGNKDVVVSTTSFDVLAYNFTLPLAYNRANYVIEASYQASVLSRAVSNSQKPKSFLYLGFYYVF